jgi:hypothetical protein
MIRLALHAAVRKWVSGSDIRSAVERLLAASPPDRGVGVDPSPEMGELLVHELKTLLGIPASACTVEDVARDPGRVAGALTLVLPYHVATVRALAPGASVEVVTLEVAEPDRKAITSLPAAASSCSYRIRRRCRSRPCSCAASVATRSRWRRIFSPARRSGSAWSRPPTS